MAWIFEVRDKTGRIIHLSSERWAHIQKHTDMADAFEQIKEALVRPTRHLADPDELSRGLYYRHDKKHSAYLFVVAKYLNGEGFVITAYYTA